MAASGGNDLKHVWASEYGSSELNRLFAAWASMRLFAKPDGFKDCCTLGVFSEPENKLVAVVVYHNYHRLNGVIEISCVTESRWWLRDGILHEMFRRPFEVMGCRTVCMRVPPENKYLAKVLRKYGFRSYTIPDLRGWNGDEVVFTLNCDQWRSNAYESPSTDISQSVRQSGSEAA